MAFSSLKFFKASCAIWPEFFIINNLYCPGSGKDMYVDQLLVYVRSKRNKKKSEKNVSRTLQSLFTLTRQGAMQTYFDKRKRLHKKILQLTQESPSQTFFVLLRDDTKNGCEFTITKSSRKIRLESKQNTTFWSYQRKISGSNGADLKRQSCLSGRNVSNENWLHFFSAIFDTSFRPSRPSQ